MGAYRGGRDPGRAGLVRVLNAIARARDEATTDPAAARPALVEALRAAGLRDDEAARTADLILADLKG